MRHFVASIPRSLPDMEDFHQLTGALEGLVTGRGATALPEELWAHVALYASGPPGRAYRDAGRRGELLALRAASKHMRDAVARAVLEHKSCKTLILLTRYAYAQDDPSHIVALGKVFGAGCRELSLGCGTSDISLLTRACCENFLRKPSSATLETVAWTRI